MKRKMKLFIVVALSVCALGLPLHTAVAAPVDPLAPACVKSDGTVINSPNCPKTTKNPLIGPDGVLMKVARIIAIIAGVVAVIIIIVSGIRYMTSNGDPKKAGDAKNAVIGALIGLVIIALSSLIIMFVIQRI